MTDLTKAEVAKRKRRYVTALCEECGQEAELPRKRCNVCRRLICLDCWDVSDGSAVCRYGIKECSRRAIQAAGAKE